VSTLKDNFPLQIPEKIFSSLSCFFFVFLFQEKITSFTLFLEFGFQFFFLICSSISFSIYCLRLLRPFSLFDQHCLVCDSFTILCWFFPNFLGFRDFVFICLLSSIVSPSLIHSLVQCHIQFEFLDRNLLLSKFSQILGFCDSNFISQFLFYFFIQER